MNYNNKKFKPVINSENGEIDTETIFHYKQDKNILTAEYSGTNIKKGHLIGTVDKLGKIQMSYHQINKQNEIMTGICFSIPEILSDGKIRLHEKWTWTSGDKSEGYSVIEEI